MTYAHTARPQGGLFFSGLFANYAETKVETFRRRLVAKTARELESLTDAQLKDIGIAREDIHQRAYQSVYNGVPYRQ